MQIQKTSMTRKISGLTAFVLSILFAWPATAFMNPGPPPWSCEAISACSKVGACAPLISYPLGFNLLEIPNEENKFVVEGEYAHRQTAMIFPNIEDAERYIESDIPEGGVSMVLVPYNDVHDAHSFSAHVVLVNVGTNKRFIDKAHIIIACNTIRK